MNIFYSPFCEDDPFNTPEYQQFVEDMVKYCHCSRNQPCDGVLAGGICDDVQEDRYEEYFCDEEE